MSTETNNEDISRTKKKQQEVEAKENEIEETLENTSDKPYQNQRG
jgi:hypothetical protein